jgi:F-type H+-transporting ATPase subunit delta
MNADDRPEDENPHLDRPLRSFGRIKARPIKPRQAALMETLLPEIAAQFAVLKNANEGAADAEIVSAFEISGDQLAQLVATLEKKFGRKLNPTVTVDPSLIGGVRVVVGDEVLDTSVRAKLQQMHVALVS